MTGGWKLSASVNGDDLNIVVGRLLVQNASLALGSLRNTEALSAYASKLTKRRKIRHHMQDHPKWSCTHFCPLYCSELKGTADGSWCMHPAESNHAFMRRYLSEHAPNEYDNPNMYDNWLQEMFIYMGVIILRGLVSKKRIGLLKSYEPKKEH
jgi:hypothetical protein